ncbi:MAG: 50S ribosomal protein L30 [Candidatus Sumerlaeota bacterium]|nr:50S ribosomal protein L30 [Candidatus Sumerlaeota bacterium]
MSQVQIKLVKSPIGRMPSHRETARRLGLRKVRQTVTHERTAQIDGMIRTIGYMLEVKEVAE